MTGPAPSATRRFANVRLPIPGPRALALAEREQPYLAPGIQQISTLAGLAFDHGEGALLVDVDGNRYLDFVAGIGVCSIGHGHPALAEALAAQAARISAGSFASEARATLLERIAGQTRRIGSGALGRVQLYSGGAEAVESALRLARAHTRKFEVISFWGGFHGKTAGVLGLMGSDFKHKLGPQLPGAHLTPYPDGRGWDTARCIEHLELTIKLHTTGQIAAILVEPIQGTAGNIIPPPDFLPAVKEVARRHGALLILDEMITGWGRTGRMFGQEHDGVEADILTFGKGVANGFPLTGLVTTDAIVADADPWSRPSFSSSSYGGAPLGAAAGEAVTRVIVEERLDQHAAEIGRLLLGTLGRLSRFPCVGEVRGRGLLLGVDLVTDKAARTPLPRSECEWIFRACLERGLLTMGYSPRIRINPPLSITAEQALEGVAILDEVLGLYCARRR